MSQAVVLAGVGETKYSRKSPLTTAEGLIEAARLAVVDSRIDPKLIDGSIGADPRMPVKGPQLQMNGLTTRRFEALSPIVAGAGVGWSIAMAKLAIENNVANAVICYVGKNSYSDTAEWAPAKLHADDPYKAFFELPYGWFPQPVYFGTVARRHMAEFGTTPEQLGAVAVACREFACLNENAIMRKPMSIDDYLDSPMVADPLRRPDCCLISDGAAAVVVARADLVSDDRPVVKLLSSSESHRPGGTYQAQSRDFVSCAAPGTADVFEKAGVTPADVDVAYIYDCFTISVLLQLEGLGFCKRGEGGSFVEDVGVGIGGKLPINTNGGLLSQAHISGMNHIVESVKQLRGECGDRQLNSADLALFSGFGEIDHVSLLMGTN